MERLKGLIARKRTGRSQGSSTSSQPTTSKAVAGIQGARNVQVTNANINVVGGDSHTHVHNHAPLTGDLKAILDAIANMRKIQQDTLAKATPGTLEWLFKSQFFGSWWDMNSDRMMVWGSGIPGAGKTILSSILINDIECRAAEAPDQICVAYFYMRYSEHGEVTVRSVLEVLVKQSVERHERFLPLVAQTYERHIRERTKPTEEQLLGLLREFIARTLITVYALDALDEAPVNIQLDLVKRLASLNARIFITSRPMQDLQVYFPKACCFDIAARSEDLDLHIAQKLESSPRLQSLLARGDAAQKELLISTVKSKCGGITALAFILSAKIEDVYQQTLERISNQDPEHIAIVKTALLWVVHAKSSMTVNELRHAVATCPEISRFEEDRLVPASTIVGLVMDCWWWMKRAILLDLSHLCPPPGCPCCGVHDPPHGEWAPTYSTKPQFRRNLLLEALEADPLLAYAHEAWAFHALKALDLQDIANQLREFVLGCRSFPVLFAMRALVAFEHLRPVHMLVFYDLPTECLLPCIIVDEHTCIERHTALGFALRLCRHDTVIELLLIPCKISSPTFATWAGTHLTHNMGYWPRKLL
ncbi:hypothetical protein BKA70DRAFT_1235469 [Coprinopsis sp. MPI-PUGE-AT-0042]|nr:hypothetical protein BKA70DRAFT_1235469 [Coprinopsis sp. MPI-PUGE-AT-0042]